MDLAHRFTVPTSVEETWAHFNDIATVAQCFPGATVTSVDEDSFSGSVKVKLGPIALVYNGSGTFVEKDEAAHKFVVNAQGKDKRGNGTAGAVVTLTMTPANSDSSATDVEVLTDLAITGKPAQFGRGVMQDVSDKLLGQFVSCLEARLRAPAEDATAKEAVGEIEEPGPAAAGSVAAGPATSPSAADRPSSTGTPLPPRAVPPVDDSLDLGATVLPIVLKSYWKQAVAGLLALIVLRRLFRRR
jgi:carbon monoxide dehydrogenase subunit G